jgi:PAS domain S-box-containing protein
MTVPSILVLESDQNIAQDLSGRLFSLGYHLLPVVEYEREALAAIQAGKPEMILLDLHFGGLHAGPQLAAHIRQVYDLPVIFIVSDKNSPAPGQAEMVEAYGFIVAPFNETCIRATLELAGHYYQKEKTIRASQYQLSAILKSIGDGIVTIDEQGLIQFINPIAVNLTGLSEIRAIGTSLDSVVTIINKATQQQINASDLVRSHRNTGPLSGFDVELLGPNGVRIPVDGSVAPLRNHLGYPNGAVIAFQSLSEIQNSLEKIKAQAARSEALLRIIAHINSKLKIDDMLASFLQESIDVLGADAATVFLSDGESESFRIVSTQTINERLSAYASSGFEFKHEIIQGLLTQDHSISYFPNIQALYGLPFHAFCIQEDIRSVVLARLQHEDQILGVLIVITTGRERDYSREELQFIKGLADYASVALSTGRLIETLSASRSRLQMVTRRLVEVQEAERRAVARELHDQVGQMLTGLQFSLESGKRSAEGDLRAIIEGSQQLVASLMKQIRALSLKLSPSMLDDMGLLPTLLWHFDQYQAQTGINVRFSQSGLEKRFSSEIEITVYRIIQETLTNVARYAKVDNVEVTVSADDEVLHLQVIDLGCGFDLQKTFQRKTFGLTSMKERAFLVGGQLSIQTAPGAGTHVLVSIPVSGRTLDGTGYDH